MEKTPTLQRALQDAKSDVVSKYLSYRGPTKEINDSIHALRVQELCNTKKSVIERFAENYQGIADVVNGNATFHSYAEPILKHVKHIEEVHRDAKPKLIRKKTLLGESRESRMFSTSESSREAVQYLREQQIIDPSRFFNSRLIYPGANTIAKLQKSPATFPTIIGTGFVGGIVGAYSGYQLGGVDGSFIGGIVGYVAPMISLGILPFSLGDGRIEAITEQREKFEKALTSLDEDVRKFFH